MLLAADVTPTRAAPAKSMRTSSSLREEVLRMLSVIREKTLLEKGEKLRVCGTLDAGRETAEAPVLFAKVMSARTCCPPIMWLVMGREMGAICGRGCCVMCERSFSRALGVGVVVSTKLVLAMVGALYAAAAAACALVIAFNRASFSSPGKS